MNLSLLNSLCYTAGWFWCVHFGIQGHPVYAAIGAIFLIIFQLYMVKVKDTSLYIQDILLAIFSIPLGVLLEMFFIQINLIRYSNSTSMLPPIWIICLYPLFSLLVNHSLKIISKHYVLSFLFGLVGAPFSYIAGHYLGALSFAYPLSQTFILIGVCWGLFLCLLTKTGKIIQKAAQETLADCNSETKLKLLYDGKCPICKREICILEKKNNQSKTEFIDITSPDFMQFKHLNIDYNTAMEKIHAIDSKGNILIGLPAFAAVYANCGLLITSTLLRIPFIKTILNPLYTLFAKNRLLITGRRK